MFVASIQSANAIRVDQLAPAADSVRWAGFVDVRAGGVVVGVRGGLFVLVREERLHEWVSLKRSDAIYINSTNPSCKPAGAGVRFSSFAFPYTRPESCA